MDLNWRSTCGFCWGTIMLKCSSCILCTGGVYLMLTWDHSSHSSYFVVVDVRQENGEKLALALRKASFWQDKVSGIGKSLTCCSGTGPRVRREVSQLRPNCTSFVKQVVYSRGLAQSQKFCCSLSRETLTDAHYHSPCISCMACSLFLLQSSLSIPILLLHDDGRSFIQ